MAGDVKADNQPYDDINITPMLDLAYVLLVTFIIMTTASVQGVKVQLQLCHYCHCRFHHESCLL